MHSPVSKVATACNGLQVLQIAPVYIAKVLPQTIFDCSNAPLRNLEQLRTHFQVKIGKTTPHQIVLKTSGQRVVKSLVASEPLLSI